MKKQVIKVSTQEIQVVTREGNDNISLTDIARYKSVDTSAIIQNWMRSRDIIDFLGLWEILYNQGDMEEHTRTKI